MTGPLRGFNVEEYLGAGTEGEGAVAWAVGNDAVPDKVAVAASLGSRRDEEARILVVMDYQKWKDGNAVLRDAGRMLELSLPGVRINLRASYGPFEDDEGCSSHFDGAVGRMTGAKKIKRLRVDLLTSCAKVLREVASFGPDFVIGFGQGGVIVGLIRWPLVAELTLQARNLQVNETVKVGSAWGRIKGTWSVNPRVWKTQGGAGEEASACPELQKKFPVDPIRGFGVGTKQGRPDELEGMFEVLRLNKVSSIDSVALKSMLQEPPREMWEHGGYCSCGKRTYLFSRCPACIEREAAEELESILEREHAKEAEESEENDLQVEVGAMVAATESRFEAFLVPVELLKCWASSGFQSCLGTAESNLVAETKFGRLEAVAWKKGTAQPKLEEEVEGFPFQTVWIALSQDKVVQGHQCCRREHIEKLDIRWSAPFINWHNHRHVVTNVCEKVWATREVSSLPGVFCRLIHLVGDVFRIEGWNDGNGTEALGHRKSLRSEKEVVCFQEEEGTGHWTQISLAKKIVVQEGPVRRTLAFVCKPFAQDRVILRLNSMKWTLTDWDGPCSDGKGASVLASGTEVLEREQLAEEARANAGISEFKVTGSLRSSWYEAQRKDASLAGYFKKVEHPFKLASDGVLEREVKVKTGQVLSVPVVPNGLAAANGLTWRKACFNGVHSGVLGAHRSADVTYRLLERSVWWPGMLEDVRRWVSCCLSCLKGRSRPTKVETKPVKCSASTCWEEVSVDCEGPNREDKAGYRYSLTYFCCLSHAVLLEPLKALTHAEVRKGFTRCILRARTIPLMVRSDRGVEFKNSLMAELNALLGVQQRFSMALRPCELGSNERVHQEVQKVLGALVRELGHSETWSDWLIVAEYVLDNTPGPHGYTPRDLERSWSLALPLEKDVLREALSFEPVTDWAKNQFAQFKEISAVVAKHWDTASAARAKLANRFRRTVELKIGDRVVWKSPQSRPEGAGRMPWKPGLNGPWVIVEVKGHRLLLEPAPSSTVTGAKKRIEAHAEDCVLIPADSEVPESREPIVFEDDQEGAAPSLGQQASGEAKPIEFSLTRRGRQFVLRIGERVAYRRDGTKICYLGQVTQVDSALATVSVHRYIPEVGGMRVKWRLAYLDEEGQLGWEGTRAALEPVTIKEIICKIDINRDGVLAASSARKLDKGGYSLQERVPAADVAALDVEPLKTELLEIAASGPRSDLPSVWQTVEGQTVCEWFETHPIGQISFWEVLAGQFRLTAVMRQEGFRVGPGLGQGSFAFGRRWDLTAAVDAELFWALYKVLQPAAVHVNWSRLSDDNESTVLLQLAERILLAQKEIKAYGSFAHLVSSPVWQKKGWIEAFGPLSSPRHPWQYARVDECQFGIESSGHPTEGGRVWLGNFCLSSYSLRCKKSDSLWLVEHAHHRTPGSQELHDDNLYGGISCFMFTRCLAKALERCPVPAREAVSLPRKCRGQSEGVFATAGPGLPPASGVSAEMTQKEKAALEAEIEALTKKMDAYWKEKADACDWDAVKADLGVYRLSGQKVESDPRRTAEYRAQVVDGLGFDKEGQKKRPEMNNEDIAACREVLGRKAGGFWLEGSPRTTVRNVLHDCVPVGPPVSSQPHNLKGEAAAWVDQKLEEEVQRGQLVRGSSAWGSPPFPTKEMPQHKRHRKRRLVVDYRRVNARVQRSTYYCRKATDVLASAAGSIWYSFVDAVTGFNQIANTRRAMEVLAIVARSGKFLPVCLTFGPVNGPDDFCFVVDRAYGPGRNRKMRYTKEWVAYVDDLTVRTGRVVDGRFLTDEEAEKEIREACQGAAVEAPQTASSALEALGVKAPDPEKKKAKHSEEEVDHNHPTRSFRTKKATPRTNVKPSRSSLRCWVVGFVSFASFSVHVSFPQPFCWPETSGGPQGVGWAAVDRQPFSASVLRDSRPEVAWDQSFLAGPAGLDPGFLDKTADRGMGRKDRWRKKYWEDLDEMLYQMVRAYRHGEWGHKTLIKQGGWVDLEKSAAAFRVDRSWLYEAIERDANKGKSRLMVDILRSSVRAIQGHSSDAGLSDLRALYEEV